MVVIVVEEVAEEVVEAEELAELADLVELAYLAGAPRLEAWGLEARGWKPGAGSLGLEGWRDITRRDATLRCTMRRYVNKEIPSLPPPLPYVIWDTVHFEAATLHTLEFAYN